MLSSYQVVDMPALKVVKPFKGISGYDHHTREFVREFVRQGLDIELQHLPNWSRQLVGPMRETWFDRLDRPTSATTALHFVMPPHFVPAPGLKSANSMAAFVAVLFVQALCVSRPGSTLPARSARATDVSVSISVAADQSLIIGVSPPHVILEPGAESVFGPLIGFGQRPELARDDVAARGEIRLVIVWTFVESAQAHARAAEFRCQMDKFAVARRQNAPSLAGKAIAIGEMRLAIVRASVDHVQTHARASE